MVRIMTTTIRLGDRIAMPVAVPAGNARWERLATAAGIGLCVAVWIMLVQIPGREDAYAYWSAPADHPYRAFAYGVGAYLYSPAFLQLIAPLRLLPLSAFELVVAGLSLAALVYVCRAWTIPALLFPPVMVELATGNIHLLLAAALVVSWRHPAAWSTFLLTKITPGVGLVWFVVRREWRNLAIALGATALMSAVSFAIWPGQWLEWVGFIVASGTNGGLLVPRLALCALVIGCAAIRDDRRLLVVGVTLAMPVFYLNSLSVLIALRVRSRPGPGR
jgi:hypothetical protein